MANPNIGPLWKTKAPKTKINRQSTAYKRKRAEFLAAYEQHGGWWVCWCGCGKWTQDPEVDHTNRVGMGGRPSVLMDDTHWAILTHECHQKKDSGMRIK